MVVRLFIIVVYFKTIKRDLNKRLIYECRCDEDYTLKLRNLHDSLILYYEIFETIKCDLMEDFYNVSVL